MSWSRIDDTLHGHPKVLDADLEAMGLWVLTLSHCAAYLTDGHVKRAAAVRLAGSIDRLEGVASRLVVAGLWEVHPSGDGWQVHDYLDYNPTREQVIGERERQREGGRRGAAKRWGSGPAELPAALPPVPTPSRVVAPKNPPVDSTGRGTRIPKDWRPGDALLRWAANKGFDANPCVERFVNFWLASSGRTAAKRDWDAAFRTWVLKDIEDGRATPLPPAEYRSPANGEATPGDPSQAGQVHAVVEGLTRSRSVVVPFAKKGDFSA